MHMYVDLDILATATPATAVLSAAAPRQTTVIVLREGTEAFWAALRRAGQVKVLCVNSGDQCGAEGGKQSVEEWCARMDALCVRLDSEEEVESLCEPGACLISAKKSRES